MPPLQTLSPLRTSGPAHQPEPAERWRLHPQARLHWVSATTATLHCAGRRWILRGLVAPVTDWLGGLGTWPRPLPPPPHPQARRLANWLHQQGLATRCELGTTLLVPRGRSCLLPGIATSLGVRRGRLPQPDDLALFNGLVVLEDSSYDRALAWSARRAGVPQVVAELTPAGARVGSFLAEFGCARCDDLAHPTPQSLLAGISVMSPRPVVPGWISDWAANQVVLAVRRWQAGADLTPGWWWLDAQGRSGHQPVRVHPECCGSVRRPSAGALAA